MGAPDHSSRKHAMLSASKADRWINCTPSARLEEKVEETGKPSKYAEEGTLAHEMAECYLRARFRITPVDVTSAELRKLKKNGLYTEDMDEPVMAYCQYVTDQYAEPKTLSFSWRRDWISRLGSSRDSALETLALSLTGSWRSLTSSLALECRFLLRTMLS